MHSGLIFSDEEIRNARKNLNRPPQKAAYGQVKEIADRALSYKARPVRGALSVPKFYADRAAWRKASYELETSAGAMIACANMYRLTDGQKYANKVVELASLWTNSITGYATEQAQHEANWNLQIMATACGLMRDYSSELTDFIKWDRAQCLTLIRLNKRENNLYYWLAAHMAVAGIANKDKKLFGQACAVYKKAIREDMEIDGHMPKETARGCRGIHYTFFAIDPLVFIAEAAKHQGRDLFSYTCKGRSLLTAIKYVMPFTKSPEKWPWSREKQDFSVFPGIHSGWCEIAYREWKLEELKDFLDKHRPLFDTRNGGAQTLFHGV